MNGLSMHVYLVTAGFLLVSCQYSVYLDEPPEIKSPSALSRLSGLVIRISEFSDVRKDVVILDLGESTYTSIQPISEYVSHAITSELRRNGIKTIDRIDPANANVILKGDVLEYSGSQIAGFWDVATIYTCVFSLEFFDDRGLRTLYTRTYSGRYQFSDWLVSWQDEDIRNLVGNCTYQIIQQISSDQKLVQALSSVCP